VRFQPCGRYHDLRAGFAGAIGNQAMLTDPLLDQPIDQARARSTGMAEKSKEKKHDKDGRKSTGRKTASDRIEVRQSGVHGKGVYAIAAIAEGERIIEYKGETISWKEALKRHPHDPEDPNHTFYFSLDEGGSITPARPTARPAKRRAACSFMR
jgi:hypothetical protein